ncbi:MAG: exodeoxyribonuclease VII large subunit [Deltaproteobacteria bacterium]|nr:exodeoxyribonuclease VII large subunit [Deltaproteobacteria bacterium]
MANDLPHIYTVTSLTREIRERLETQFAIVWVSGEVSNLRQAASGHIYFTLKDEGAQLRAVLFKGNHQYMRHKPQDGNKVLCRGRLTVWELRGEYQLIVDYLEPLGLGALAQAFEALKTRLAAEGLFDPAHKKPLPYLPRRLALVTSPTGAVVRDFLRLLKQRHSNIEVLIYPVKVQGAEAGGEIARALDELNAYPGIEVIVLARGGGSLEDLWPFNEEIVARAIYRSNLPVVSAVGHEVDYTIADFVADVRAATPSHAVELVAPDKAELTRRLYRLAASLYRGWTRHLEGERRHLAQVARRLPDMRRQVVDLRLRVDERGETLARRVRRCLAERRREVRLAGSRLFLLSPGRNVIPARQRLDQSGQRLLRSWQQNLGQRRRHLDYCASHLAKLDPMSILQRGYAVATKLPEGTIIRDALAIPPGAEVRVQVAKGRMDCRVLEAGE